MVCIEKHQEVELDLGIIYVYNVHYNNIIISASGGHEYIDTVHRYVF